MLIPMPPAGAMSGTLTSVTSITGTGALAIVEYSTKVTGPSGLYMNSHSAIFL